MSYLLLGKKRSLSHSCLVASSIELPNGLEDRVRNLDEVFVEQLNIYHKATASIEKMLEHPIMQKWEQISKIVDACEARVQKVSRGDYFRALSYGAMRMLNCSMTDVLNTILPIKEFMEGAIKKHEEEEKNGGGEVEEIKEDLQSLEIIENLELVEEELEEELEEPEPEPEVKIDDDTEKPTLAVNKGGKWKRAARWLFKRLFNVRPF